MPSQPSRKLFYFIAVLNWLLSIKT